MVQRRFFREFSEKGKRPIPRDDKNKNQLKMVFFSFGPGEWRENETKRNLYLLLFGICNRQMDSRRPRKLYMVSAQYKMRDDDDGKTLPHVDVCRSGDRFFFLVFLSLFQVIFHFILFFVNFAMALLFLYVYISFRDYYYYFLRAFFLASAVEIANRDTQSLTAYNQIFLVVVVLRGTNSSTS